jgi:hypothetical protein
VIAEVLLEPLGMRNTRFGFPETPSDFEAEDTAEGPFIMGGGGILSTLDDLAIFYQALLDRGLHRGRRAFETAIADRCRTPEIDVASGTGLGADGLWGPEYAFGLFLARPDDEGEYQEFNHSGAFGTFPWAEADRRLVVVLAGQDGLRATMQIRRQVADLLHRIIDEDPLVGPALYDDVKAYANFGFHGTGTEADHATAVWMADHLRSLGYETEVDSFTARQFFNDSTTLAVGDRQLTAFPLWFPKATGPTPVEGPLEWSTDGRVSEGAIAVVPNDDNWGGRETVRPMRAVSAAAGESGAAGLVIVTRTLPGEFAATNIYADAAVPAVLVGGKDEAFLKSAIEAGASARLKIDGRIDPEASSYQVTGTKGTAPRQIVITTPISAFTTAAGERGPGVALFRGLAAWAANRRGDIGYTFITVAGHEVQGMGIRDYMEKRPPAKDSVVAWLHLGGGVAVYNWEGEGDDFRLVPPQPAQVTRLYSNKQWIIDALSTGFSDLPNYKPELSDQGVGYLAFFIRLGYEAFGFECPQPHHHLPNDMPFVTGPEVLEPVARALVRTFEEIEQRDAARERAAE